MAQQGTIRRLDIAHLGLDKDHMPYSDGVACIQAYWAYSMDLTQDERNNMRNLIINLNYRHTLASREEFYEHHLCRDPAGRTRPGLVILRALYKVVPVDFENGVVARCGPLPVRNRSDEYFALFPDTIGPPVFDMETGRARRYQQRYPLLKVTPSTLRNRDQAVLPAPQDTPSPTIPPASPTAISPVPASVMDTVFEEISASPLAILIPETLMQPPSTTTEANSPVTRQEFDQLCLEVATLAENVSMLQRAFERQRQRRREQRREIRRQIRREIRRGLRRVRRR